LASVADNSRKPRQNYAHHLDTGSWQKPLQASQTGGQPVMIQYSGRWLNIPA
jgi:hypothetical protein